jgi:hypothetical protein
MTWLFMTLIAVGAIGLGVIIAEIADRMTAGRTKGKR